MKPLPSIKDIPESIRESWHTEWEQWWAGYAKQFEGENLDCCDYQDEQQAFYREKINEYHCN